MKRTMKNLMKQTMKDINTDRIDWILKWPAQCVLAINKTRWTRNAENAILQWVIAG